MMVIDVELKQQWHKLTRSTTLHSTPLSQPNCWLWPAMVAQSEDWRTSEANPEVEIQALDLAECERCLGTPAVVRPVPASKCRQGGNSIINDVRLK